MVVVKGTDTVDTSRYSDDEDKGKNTGQIKHNGIVQSIMLMLVHSHAYTLSRVSLALERRVTIIPS